MDIADYTNLEKRHGQSLAAYQRTLHETSASEDDNGNITGYCLENKRAGKLTAVWFDEVMSDWTNLPACKASRLPMTRRIDAYYVKGPDAYLIEFKRDGDLQKFKDDFWLKFHDSLAQLLDHKWTTLSEAKEHLHYIVVTPTRFHYQEGDFDPNLSEGEKSKWLLLSTSLGSDLMQRPWNYPIRSRCGLWRFEGVTCKKALTITASQFDRFASDNKWT